MTLFVLAAAIAAPMTLKYMGPEDPSSPLDRYEFSEWNVGDEPFVAVDGANLRAGPGPDAPVVVELPMGTRVRIHDASAGATRVGDRVDRWYGVKAAGREGFLFGPTLTPAHWRLDFDGDGRKEQVTVAWTSRFKIRVRVRTAEGKVAAVSLQPYGEHYRCCGAIANIERVKRSTAGIELLEVHTTSGACGDYGRTWISIHEGKPHKALEASGFADPPNYLLFETQFDQKRRSAAITVLSSCDDTGKNCQEKRKTTYRLAGGVFVAVGR